MERTVFRWVLILVTLVTVGAASATSSSLPTNPPASLSASLAAFLPAGGRLSITSPAHATPSVKGKVFLRYVSRLTPPRSSGEVVGDRGATGRVTLKGVKASASASYVVFKMRVNKIQSGGAAPFVDAVSTCLDGKFAVGYEGSEWENITSATRGGWPWGGRRKRYSFATSIVMGPGSQTDVRTFIGTYTHLLSGMHLVASHPENDHALCGKMKKRPV